MNAPTLTTSRLILRAHVASDFGPSLELWNETELKRHVGDKGSTPNAVWNRILRYAGLWTVLGYGFWAVTDRATGEYLGEAGLANFERAIEPPLGATPEGGWWLISSARGKGLATEAMQAMQAMQAILGWSDDTLAQDTCCILDPDNWASMRVAEKLGYTAHSTGRLNGTELQIYRRRPCASIR